MATLTNDYQYLGRSTAMTSQNGSYSYYILLYGKTSANKTTGIHTVTIKEVLASTTTKATYYQYNAAHNGTINGTTAFSGTNKPSTAWNLTNLVEGGVTYKTWIVLDEGSVNVDCTNGLSKDITLTCYYAFKASGATYTPANNTNRTVSVTATLSAIPRQATILTAPNFNDSANPTITYSNPSGSNVTSLEAAIYNSSGSQSYIPYKTISKTDTSYTFALTDAERSNLLNATQGSNTLPIRFYIRTVIGGTTFLSYLDRTFTIADANPVITASVVDTNSTTIALTGDSKKLIKYYSNAKATMTAEAQKGAAIDEDLCIIRNGDTTSYGETYTFNNIESNVFTFSAEDNRGNVGTNTITPSMVSYVKLTCNMASNRPDALGNMSVACSGNYFNGSFGAATNTLKVQYRYTISGNAFTDNWVDMAVTKSGNSYSAHADFQIPSFNQQYFYSFETRAVDKLDTVTSAESSVKSIPVFHWGENDFVFEVPVTFNAGVSSASALVSEATESDTYDGNKTITGNLRLKGKNSNYGNFLLFGDSNYCYINEPTDDEMKIHAKKIYLDASSGVFVDGYAIPILDKGTWTPALNSSVVSSYTTQYGWYSKMGQTVTVGFYIKATCKSGYTSTLITISGLPFTPMYSAAGGGMCSGAYVSGGQNFQCYVAETSKSITTRVQSCNHTSQTNLSTSASGCWYPTGGGEVTLSGTITFMATT